MHGAGGRTLPLSLARRLQDDHTYFARQVHSIPVERRMRLSAVAEARAAAGLRPGWRALFTKAFALVAASLPPLRRAYLPFPWPHLYQHPDSVAAIAFERRLGEEAVVLPALLDRPEQQGLATIDAWLRRHQEQPPETLPAFRDALRAARLPRPLRRWRTWAMLHVSGARRARLAGTFAVHDLGSLGAAILHPQSPLTTTLGCGVVGPDGTVDVRLAYDPRVLDGGTVARALADCERVLVHDILAELRYLQHLAAA